jgi:hypothetical protein
MIYYYEVPSLTANLPKLIEPSHWTVIQQKIRLMQTINQDLANFRDCH